MRGLRLSLILRNPLQVSMTQMSMLMSDLNGLKEEIFSSFLDIAGRVYIVVQYSERTSLGKRKFQNHEIQSGITLVFNREMHFSWEPEGLYATLTFGTAAHKCFIHADDILSIYCPELNAQFTCEPVAQSSEASPLQAPHLTLKSGGQDTQPQLSTPHRVGTDDLPIIEELDEEGKVIHVDFTSRNPHK